MSTPAVTPRRGEGFGQALGGGHDGGGVHAAGLAGEALDRAGDRHGRDHLAAGGADRGGDRRDALLALADGVRPAATPYAGQGGRVERRVVQTAVHPLRVLPREQYLSGGTGRHRELAAHRDGVAQAGRTLGGGDAHPVLTLAAEQLRRLAGDVPQPCQHRAGGRQQPVLAGGRGQLAESRAEHEASLHVAADQPVVLESDRQAVSRRTCQTRGRHESGQGRRPGFEGGQHEGCFVENTDSARVVHETILPSRIVERKSLRQPNREHCERKHPRPHKHSQGRV